MSSFVAAAVLYVWVYFCQFLFNYSLFQQPLQMQSFSFAHKMHLKCVTDLFKGGVTLCGCSGVEMYACDMYVRLCVCVCACVSKPVWCWWLCELCQDCSHHSWISASFKGLGRTMLEGPRGGGGRLYLSPRMAYWLSSCNCCIEAPPVSSLPRFLCFTTSKVFSISLSLRVSTCLAVESREGNCVSL